MDSMLNIYGQCLPALRSVAAVTDLWSSCVRSVQWVRVDGESHRLLINKVQAEAEVCFLARCMLSARDHL